MQRKTNIIALLMSVIMLVTFSSCADNKAPDVTTTTTATTTITTTAATETTTSAAPETKITKDREGNDINLPDKIEKIISMGPSNTEVLAALGFGDKIIAADDYSAGIDGVNAEIPMFSMMTPDGEQIINLQPDVIFVTGMSKAGGEDPFKTVADAGICIVYIPSSASIEGIKEDIRFMAAVMGAEEQGETIVSDMEKEIETVAEIGRLIPDGEKKTVYFEISAAPYMYSFGAPTFLNEMLEIIGAKNAFGNQEEAWISVSDEVVLAANPDVILTSVNYIENPTDEIKARPGWEEIKAVKDGAVYSIDTNSSNRPSHNITKALLEMAKAVYPDKYN